MPGSARPEDRPWPRPTVAERVRFLSADEVLAIRHGLAASALPAASVDDLGLLESALHRPRTGHYRDLPEMAAALFESLLMNRPFANLRLAFFATDVFLRLNGWQLEVDVEWAWSYLVGLLEEGRCDYDHLEPWIRRAVRQTAAAGGLQPQGA